VLPAQWTHGDFEWRNVLFDANDEVAGIIDFDDAQYFSPARDVIRCIALSFASLGHEADQFVAGYASVRALSPAEVRGYVEFYRYLSTFRVWPLVNRYRYPERYRPEWDALIQPFFPWDWTALSERLAEVAAGASQR
jgi:Ser/Thr protein kinase RdoA (MazF antagonist)